jgi:hypothetical protein
VRDMSGKIGRIVVMRRFGEFQWHLTFNLKYVMVPNHSENFIKQFSQILADNPIWLLCLQILGPSSHQIAINIDDITIVTKQIYVTRTIFCCQMNPNMWQRKTS